MINTNARQVGFYSFPHISLFSHTISQTASMFLLLFGMSFKHLNGVGIGGLLSYKNRTGPYFGKHVP